MAQQQQNLHLFKTMLQEKEVYLMDVKDEVNKLVFFKNKYRGKLTK